MVIIYINNQKVVVPAGSSILEACKQAGVIIPRFCYHENLSVAGNCRMCLVEIEKSPKPVAACAMPVSNNMVIFTNSPLVKKARENVIESLLLNHPLDCPICDQGGECDLQDQTFLYGSGISRNFVKRRSVTDKNFGPLIKSIMTRCIHCTRCVRYSTEIAGIEMFGTLKRGTETEIGSYINKLFYSEISGNVIDLCPVGALTSKPYAFIGRPWELRKFKTIDFFDCIGSNIQVEIKETEIVRITPRFNKDINQDWISDKIRFFYDSLKNGRVNSFFFKKKNYNQINYNNFFKIIKLLFLNKNILIPVTKKLDNVSLFLLNQLQKINKIRIRKLFTFDAIYNGQAKISSLNTADSIFVFGANPKLETPVLNIRMRQLYLNGIAKFYYCGPLSTQNIPYLFISLNNQLLLDLLKGKNYFQQIFSSHKKPFILIGSATLNHIYNLELMISNLLNININTKYLILDNNANLTGASAYQFASVKKNDEIWADILLFLDIEDLPIIKKLINNKKKLLVCSSSHGNDLLKKTNIIIPSLTFVEASYSYLNCEGREQKTRKIIPTTNVPNKLSTIQTIKTLFNLKGINITNKVLKIIIYKSFTSIKNSIKYNLLNNKKNYAIMLSALYPLKSNIEDFYLSNQLQLQWSSILANCSNNMRKETNNFNNNI